MSFVPCDATRAASNNLRDLFAGLAGLQRRPILVPRKVEAELRVRAEHAGPQAKAALESFNELCVRKILQVDSESYEGIADNSFLNIAVKYGTTHELLVLTQDVNLAADLLTISTLQSVRRRTCQAFCVGGRGDELASVLFRWNLTGLERPRAKSVRFWPNGVVLARQPTASGGATWQRTTHGR
jgi:hypothetical protein